MKKLEKDLLFELDDPKIQNSNTFLNPDSFTFP